MRTYAEAKARAAAEAANPSRDWTGWCQVFAQACVGAAPWGASAQDAWNQIPNARTHDGTPWAGSLAYWSGGSRGFGHVAFAVENGYVYSTDILRPGKVDLVPYTTIHERWGQTYLGYIDWTPSGAINLGPANTPTLPVVSVAHLISAANHDMPAATGALSQWAGEVRLVEAALAAQGLLSGAYVDGSWGTRTRDAYRAWQVRCGWSGSAADGYPGLQSLTALARVAKTFSAVA